MKRHILAAQNGKKPHKCTICETSFSLKINLQRHLLEVHEGQNHINVPLVKARNLTSVYYVKQAFQKKTPI